MVDILELDVFTEVDTPGELDFALNDLVASYFDIPIDLYSVFRYVKSDNSPLRGTGKSHQFNLFESRAALQRA